MLGTETAVLSKLGQAGLRTQQFASSLVQALAVLWTAVDTADAVVASLTLLSAASGAWLLPRDAWPTVWVCLGWTLKTTLAQAWTAEDGSLANIGLGWLPRGVGVVVVFMGFFFDM